MNRLLLTEYLLDFERYGGAVAFMHQRGLRQESWSYQRIVRTAHQFARELEERDIRIGDRVMIWGDNCAEWVAAFFGCLLRGAIVVPMDRICAADFAARVAREVDARLLVASSDLSLTAESLPVLVLEKLSETLDRHSSKVTDPPGLQTTTAAEIIFTSGTTAEPKGVVLSHQNILANLGPIEDGMRRYLRYARPFQPVRFLNLVPLSHVFGQFMGIFVPQLMRGVVLFSNRHNPSDVIETICSHRISVLAAVPRTLEALRHKMERDYEKRDRRDWLLDRSGSLEGKNFLRKWWRYREIRSRFGWKFWAFVCGGATLNPEVEEFWRRLGYVVVQGYGLTETSSLVSLNHPMHPDRGSVGVALPGREIKIDASGEILVRGENVASGYWEGRELKPITGDEGWFHTGDMGELDTAGKLYFKGRKKNVIVTPEGLNVYPEDLEAALRAQPEVQDCVVAGLNRDGNAVPCAVLILRDPRADAGEIIGRANKHLAGYQQIRQWHVWLERDFPRTSTQKPRVSVILGTIQSHTRKEGSGVSGRAVLAELIERITGRRLASESPDIQLDADLNLGSLEQVELISALEDRFEVHLNETQITGATTLAELEHLLQQPETRRSEFVYPQWPQSPWTVWMRAVAYYLLIWPATRLLAWPRISGKANLLALRPPVLIVANHVTSVDAGFVLAALPLRFRHRLAIAMEGERLQRMRRPASSTGQAKAILDKVGYFMVLALFNVFPMPQSSGFRRSFVHAGRCADQEFSILVFPEGKMTRDGRLAPFQAGIGLLVSELNLPVVPMSITGLFELKQAGKMAAAPGTVKVKIGPPVRFGPGEDPLSITRDLQSRVAALAD